MSRRRISAVVTALVLASAVPVLLPASEASAASCSSYPSWVAGRSYVTGDIVRYTDGRAYIAEHDNPGYDPTISTWFWEPYACDNGPGTPAGTFVGVGFAVPIGAALGGGGDGSGPPGPEQ